MRLYYYIYKVPNKMIKIIKIKLNYLFTLFYFKVYNIKYLSFKTSGTPFFHIEKNGSVYIGKNLKMNNGFRYNSIGYSNPCIFVVLSGAKLLIGENLGMSQATIVCHHRIEIHDNVKLGGGVKIYDTDFHSLNSNDRLIASVDFKNKKTAKVVVNNNVFVGAGSIILKGVTIGLNSIIGAGSVVSKDIPDNEIWAGNPAKFIRRV
jgi:acetyltransferase-like isoleucine patch superfamily enzyme